jgi:carbon-monoxide dehydrogenase medium subunit
VLVVKPAAFHYSRPANSLAAVQILSAPEWRGQARILAGGQSLVPSLSCRDARPTMIVDIMACEDLGKLTVTDDDLIVGARALQAEVERSSVASEACPLLADAIRWVAVPQIRNRGTVVGSLAQANAGAEIPVVAAALDAKIERLDVTGRRNMLDAATFFSGLSGAAADPTDLLTSVRFRRLRANEGWGFAEIQLRPGHYALVCAAAVLEVSEGRIATAGLSIGGLNGNPYRATDTEAFAIGQDASSDAWIIEAARNAVAERPWPARADQHASAEYRQAMAIVVARDALKSAIRRAYSAPI